MTRTSFEPTGTTVSLPKSDKFSLILTGFDSLAQIEGFLAWYSNQGEQDDGLYYAINQETESGETVSLVQLHHPVETQADGMSILAPVEVHYEG